MRGDVQVRFEEKRSGNSSTTPYLLLYFGRTKGGCILLVMDNVCPTKRGKLRSSPRILQ